ncbi:TPA: phage protein NinX family protein [Morganella morganii]
MKTVKTSELSGRALDWAVAKSQGIDVFHFGGVVIERPGSLYAPSTQWEYCGELLEKNCIELLIYEDSYCATRTSINPRDDTDYPRGFGRDYKEAICRFVVLYKLGGTVEIPEELLQ